MHQCSQVSTVVELTSKEAKANDNKCVDTAYPSVRKHLRHVGKVDASVGTHDIVDAVSFVM